MLVLDKSCQLIIFLYNSVRKVSTEILHRLVTRLIFIIAGEKQIDVNLVGKLKLVHQLQY